MCVSYEENRVPEPSRQDVEMLAQLLEQAKEVVTPEKPVFVHKRPGFTLLEYDYTV